jgi:hypothetical protein
MKGRFLLPGVAVLAVLVTWLACLPRDNPFDRTHLEDRYQVRVTSSMGVVKVQFSPLSGRDLQGHRVYREDATGQRTLVSEVGAQADHAVDEGAAAAAAHAQATLEDGTLWWRVAGFISTGEGPMSRKTDQASTRVFPDTRVEPPPPDYISGRAAVAVLVEVVPPPSGGAAHHFRYRFTGQDWTEPLPAGPLVLTGLRDGRYTLEVAAESEAMDLDLTPARMAFTYDFHVPEGTACHPAVCSAGLACVVEPVGLFCRRVCEPGQGGAPDGGAGPDGGACPLGLTCRAGSGEGGEAACVVAAAPGEACHDRLCWAGQACGETGDGRSLCGLPCGGGQACLPAEACKGTDAGACLTVAQPYEPCAHATCTAGFACEVGPEEPVCRRLCVSGAACNVGELCEPLGRGDLRICR